MAYTFGEESGALYYSFPRQHNNNYYNYYYYYYSFPTTRRPDTASDRLALGFSSTQRQATIISISSYGLDDSVRVDLASRPLAALAASTSFQHPSSVHSQFLFYIMLSSPHVSVT